MPITNCPTSTSWLSRVEATIGQKETVSKLADFTRMVFNIQELEKSYGGRYGTSMGCGHVATAAAPVA